MEEPFLPDQLEDNTSTSRERRHHEFAFNFLDGRTTLHDTTGSPRSPQHFTAAGCIDRITASAARTPLIISFNRSRSAPSLFTEEKGQSHREILDHHKHHPPKFTPQYLHRALFGLLVYITVGVTIFTLTHDTFKGEKTVKLIDALYFTVGTFCTIGYGDITPDTPYTKLFTCFFILVGLFGLIDILLNVLVTYVLDMQEEILLDETKFNKTMMRNYVTDRTKVCLALGVIFACLAIGTFSVHFLEELSWVDSFYLSVTSVTAVGYGDRAFKTSGGRCFAIIWLLASTLAVAKAFLAYILPSTGLRRGIGGWLKTFFRRN